MRKIIVVTLLSLNALATFAQGTVNFVNLSSGAGVNAPVFQSNGVTKLVGPNYLAQLTAGSSSTSLALVGSPVAFLTGGGAGYFNGGTVTIPGVAGGATAFLQVVSWDSTLNGTTTGATEAQAYAAFQAGMNNVFGQSIIFSVVTGNPSGTPPTTPANLIGLNPYSLIYVPEPSTFALAGLGAAALIIFRRRT